MMNFDFVEKEKQALSPLGNIDGTNSLTASIEALQKSPLCWPALLCLEHEYRADRVLISLLELYEDAIYPWEQFLTIQPPISFMHGVNDDLVPINDQWVCNSFPLNIQLEAQRLYWELKTTSRFEVDSTVNKQALESFSCLRPNHMEFKHVAGLAAMVCISEALEQYEETLTEWREVISELAPGLRFEWLQKHNPDLVTTILSAYLASPKNAQCIQDRARDTAMSVKNAEDWLALVESDNDYQKEIERHRTEAVAQTLAQVKAQKSSDASDWAKSKNKNARAWVLSKWVGRPNPDESKAAFAQVYHHLVKKEFGLSVTADTIARDWLPKEKK